MRCCTDFHSHILPGVDDGSGSMAESLEMLRLEGEQGIRQVVATPHFYATQDTLEGFLARREAAWESLQQAMAGREDLPRVLLGAEVYYFSGMSEWEALSELTLAGSDYLLLEMPRTPWTQTMYREMEAIRSRRGITPVLAHIDRYISPLRSRGILRRLEQLPVLVQANGSFFLDRRTGALALGMLKKERIHLLGSDCHDLSARKPNLGLTLQKIGKRLGEEGLNPVLEYEAMVLGK